MVFKIKLTFLGQEENENFVNRPTYAKKMLHIIQQSPLALTRYKTQTETVNSRDKLSQWAYVMVMTYGTKTASLCRRFNTLTIGKQAEMIRTVKKTYYFLVCFS